MTPDVFGDRKLYAWLLGGSLPSVLLLKVGAGGGSQVEAVTVDTAESEKEMAHGVLASASCNEAQFKVDAVIATNPACKGFPHFAVCALVDGGNHGDH